MLLKATLERQCEGETRLISSVLRQQLREGIPPAAKRQAQGSLMNNIDFLCKPGQKTIVIAEFRLYQTLRVMMTP